MESFCRMPSSGGSIHAKSWNCIPEYGHSRASNPGAIASDSGDNHIPQPQGQPRNQEEGAILEETSVKPLERCGLYLPTWPLIPS